MVKNISEFAGGRIGDLILPRGELTATVTRYDGSVEKTVIRNLYTKDGMNRIANRAVVGATTSVFYVLGIGSYTVASNQASLGSVNFGEISRKVAATATQSKEFFTLVATWGGAADSVTSKAIDAGALCDHASSGSGIVGGIGQGLSVTLADSDFLNLTYRVQVGSHNLAHST
jgi:hypothetical protein